MCTHITVMWVQILYVKKWLNVYSQHVRRHFTTLCLENAYSYKCVLT